MTSKKNLKKQVKYICGDIVGELILIGELCPADKVDEVSQLVVDTAVLQQQTLSRCTFSFDKSQREFASPALYRKAKSQYERAAFGKLRDDFNSRLRDIVKRLNEAAATISAE